MRKAVEAFKFGPPFSLLDFQVELQHDDGDHVYVRVSAAFAERESGDTRRASFTKRVAYGGLNRPALLASLREVLRSFVLHELDESILVDGVRVFDPHAPGAAAADLTALQDQLEVLASPAPTAPSAVTCDQDYEAATKVPELKAEVGKARAALAGYLGRPLMDKDSLLVLVEGAVARGNNSEDELAKAESERDASRRLGAVLGVKLREVTKALGDEGSETPVALAEKVVAERGAAQQEGEMQHDRVEGLEKDRERIQDLLIDMVEKRKAAEESLLERVATLEHERDELKGANILNRNAVKLQHEARETAEARLRALTDALARGVEQWRRDMARGFSVKDYFDLGDVIAAYDAALASQSPPAPAQESNTRMLRATLQACGCDPVAPCNACLARLDLLDASSTPPAPAQDRVTLDEVVADMPLCSTCGVAMCPGCAPPRSEPAPVQVSEDAALAERLRSLKAGEPPVAFTFTREPPPPVPEKGDAWSELLTSAESMPAPLEHSHDGETGQHEEDCDRCCWEGLQAKAKAARSALPAPTQPALVEAVACVIPAVRGAVHAWSAESDERLVPLDMAHHAATLRDLSALLAAYDAAKGGGR
ncbi:hypothetical protein [Myxococcus sp. AB025B]|uniref:hypothetical protein n=1 Tax=Myxococcus sp. AB025B TaxID=2562794 RepID=UPI0011448EC0|nr:hypothetical protein [Myxococcus sp. AB025B]